MIRGHRDNVGRNSSITNLLFNTFKDLFCDRDPHSDIRKPITTYWRLGDWKIIKETSVPSFSCRFLQGWVVGYVSRLLLTLLVSTSSVRSNPNPSYRFYLAHSSTTVYTRSFILIYVFDPFAFSPIHVWSSLVHHTFFRKRFKNIFTSVTGVPSCPDRLPRPYLSTVLVGLKG